MLKKMKFAALLLFAAAVSVSCSDTGRPLKELKNLTERIEKNADDFTDEEWDEVVSELEEIEEELDKRELSDEELKEIGRLKGRCIAKMTKKAMKDAAETFDSLGKQLEGGLDGFLEGMSEED